MAPNLLADKSIAEIAQLPIRHGNRTERLGDFFRVEGDASDGVVEIDGDCSRIKMLGRRMASGRLVVRGDVGMHLGAEMTGGTIEVHGNAGDWPGAEMRAGLIRVHGSVGHSAGGAYRGSVRGMRGGAILIDGDAGPEAGAVLRRGLIAVAGRCGEFAGAGMVAGSIFAFGGLGGRAGAGMKRGTIAVFHGEVVLPPTFRYDCDYRPVFLALYLRRLQAWGFPVPMGAVSGRFRRFSGDLLALGKGEVLQLIA